VSDIQRESQVVLDIIKENDYHSAFEAWKKWWDRCIRSQEDYFEGDGSQNLEVRPTFPFWPSPGTFQ
jgi:hypothetical protein